MTPYNRVVMAIDRIKTKGWIAGMMESTNGAGCLVRSLVSDTVCAMRGDIVAHAAYTRELNEINALMPLLDFENTNVAIAWNDEQQKTLRRVLTSFQVAVQKGYIRLNLDECAHFNEASQTHIVTATRYIRTVDDVLARLEAARDRLIHQEIDKAIHTGATDSARVPMRELVGA